MRRDTLIEPFRALHIPGRPLVMPNPWDLGSAKVMVRRQPSTPGALDSQYRLVSTWLSGLQIFNHANALGLIETMIAKGKHVRARLK